jgi:hypothetical protein
MSPAELHAIVRKAHLLIADSARWAERHFAEDKSGKWVPVGSRDAVRFNLAGAMIKSAGRSAQEATRAFAELLCVAPAGLETIRWRHAEGLGRSEALELLRWALARLDSLNAQQRSVDDLAPVASTKGAGAKASQ